MPRNGTTVPLLAGDAAASIMRFGKAPRTHAVPVLDVGADDDAWKGARRKGIGASEASVLLGHSPNNSRFAMWWQKFNGWDIDSTREMWLGTRLEPIIREVFMDEFPNVLVFRPGAALWAHPDHEFMLCTPDFLAVFPDDPTVAIPIECKSDQTSKGWGKSGEPVVPPHHRVQALVQAFVFGAPLAYVAHLNGKRFTWHPIIPTAEEREEWWPTLVKDARQFVASLETGLPPDIDAIDGHDATEEMLKRLYADADDELPAAVIEPSVAEEYDRLRSLLGSVKKQYAAVQNRIRWEMGNATRAVTPDGEPVAKRTVGKSDGWTVPPHTRDQLWPSSHSSGGKK
jgi:predicted phage-related endonuclease